MMRRLAQGLRASLSASVLLWVVVLLAGCAGNEFKVEFGLDGNVDAAYRMLYYASDPRKGWVVESVVSVQKGKAETRLVTRNPCLVYVSSVGNGGPSTFFYARRGDDINITGDGRDPLGWSIDGNKINKRLTEWRLSHRAALSARGAGAVAALNKAVAEYVGANPEDPVSTLLLLLYYDRGADERGFRAAWSKLQGDALDASWRELVSRSDMLEDVPAEQPMPRAIVFNTVQTGCDTVTPGRVPALLYFSRTSCEDYKTHIDSLRRLSRAYADSSRRVIANVQLEPDSSVRWQSVRADTLTGVVQAWMPLGVSDPTARELGVRRFPWFIVIGRDRKSAYSGPDPAPALSAFRRQMGK